MLIAVTVCVWYSDYDDYLVAFEEMALAFT